MILLPGGRPLPGPKTGLLSKTRKWIVWGNTSADKVRDFIGRGHPGGEQLGKGTQENSCVTWLAVSGFMVNGISFRVVLSQSFWFRVLPGGAHLVQPGWMPERRIVEGGQTHAVSFRPFLNPSGWWWLLSSVFLTGTSCRKTTHTSGY